MTQPGRLLVVDDEGVLRGAFARALSAAGHRVVEAADGASALRAIERQPFDAVLSDMSMAGMTGIELLRAIRAHDLDLPFVVVTGHPTDETARAAFEFGALDYLGKPVDLARVVRAMERAILLGRIARIKRVTMESLTGGQVGAGDRAGRESSLDRALHTMWVAYQPVLRADGTLCGHEALLRTRVPELATPLAVLWAAEKLERLADVGRPMRRLAAQPVAADRASGLLFVNLHPRDLYDEDLLSERSPLTAIAERVVLEITERDAIGDLTLVRRRCQELRELGFSLAIDDLGALHAGISAFTALEPDVVKLDMSFVRGVDRDEARQKLVKSVSRLCRDLGMLVLAEGVETTAELACVLDLGCDLVQGFLLARPGPAFPVAVWPRENGADALNTVGAR